jgi:hypothetical protein
MMTRKSTKRDAVPPVIGPRHEPKNRVRYEFRAHQNSGLHVDVMRAAGENQFLVNLMR